MKQGAGKGTIAAQNRFVKDPLVGKTVVIVGGKFKGHRGRVSYADDRSATVELSTQCKKIPIDKTLVKELNPEESGNQGQQNGGRSMYGGQSQYGGHTVYDGGKTPGNVNTPSMYPQSQWGGQADFNENKEETGFVQRPESAHFSGQVQGNNAWGQ